MTELAPAEPWNLTAIGLQLTDPDLPYERFQELCWILGRMHEAVRFAIGDALLIGPQLYGEQAYQAFEALNLSEKGRLEYVRVSERVPRSRRRKDLSWSHHRAVAALEPAEQKQWLKTASERSMSHAELRDALRNGQEPIPVSVCRCCGRRLETGETEA